MNIEQAKQVPIADILSRLGLHPKRTDDNRSLFLSPVRNEKTPSFWVYHQTNSWYDYGDGRGGDAIAFACAYLEACQEAYTVSDALRWLKNMGMGAYSIAPVYRNPPDAMPTPSSLVLKSRKPVQHLGLTNYLQKRGISLTLAERHLSEVQVQNTKTKKSFLALGFPNEEGGLELRNPFFKSCLGHKAISFIRGSAPKPTSFHLFEGFMDYLSAVSQLPASGFKADAIVLNSLSCLKQAIPYIAGYGYRTAYTWLDNDMAGQKATATLTAFFQTQDALKHIPMNTVYAPHKDVNEWHMHKQQLTL